MKRHATLPHVLLATSLGLFWLGVSALSTLSPLHAAAEDAAKTGSGGASEREAPVLRVVGSGYTMPVFTKPWAAAFEARTGHRVVIEATGTSTGPPALLDGRAAIAAMTRPLHPAEAQALEAEFGVTPLVLPVAEDVLAVFVNTKNPVERLTIAQVDAIYSRDRLCGAREAITRWGQVGGDGEFENRSIALFGRRPGSGTGILFRQRALCGGSFKNWMRVTPGGRSASLMVAASRFGIGFGSLRDRRRGMKAISLAASDAGPFVAPDDASPGRAPYPLTRTLDFVVAIPREGPIDPTLLDFLEFVHSNDAQQEVVERGYAPLIGELRRSGLEKIRALRVRATAAPRP